MVEHFKTLTFKFFKNFHCIFSYYIIFLVNKGTFRTRKRDRFLFGFFKKNPIKIENKRSFHISNSYIGLTYFSSLPIDKNSIKEMISKIFNVHSLVDIGWSLNGSTIETDKC